MKPAINKTRLAMTTVQIIGAELAAIPFLFIIFTIPPLPLYHEGIDFSI